MSEGKKFDSGKPPMSLLPTLPLLEIAKVLQYGASKYEVHNWRKGILYSRITSAVLRHLTLWNEGEELDEESNLPHLAHAACGLLFLLEYSNTKPEMDDRYKHAE